MDSSIWSFMLFLIIPVFFHAINATIQLNKMEKNIKELVQRMISLQNQVDQLQNQLSEK